MTVAAQATSATMTRRINREQFTTVDATATTANGKGAEHTNPQAPRVRRKRIRWISFPRRLWITRFDDAIVSETPDILQLAQFCSSNNVVTQ